MTYCKLIALSLTTMLLTALPLTACTSGQPNDLSAPALTTPAPTTEVDTVTTELTSAAITTESNPSQINDTTPQKSTESPLKWQEAYAVLLRDYAKKEIGEYAASMLGIGGLFTLYDINKCGVPELIIWEASQGGFFSSYAAYTFENGVIVPLEINDRFGGRGYSIFSTPNDMPGIITVSVESGFTRHTLINMEEHSLNIKVSTVESWTNNRSRLEPEKSLYFIRGTENISIEIPDEIKEWYGWLLSLGYVLVPEDEYNTILDNIFGSPPVYSTDGIWPSAITEETIQNILFGWQH